MKTILLMAMLALGGGVALAQQPPPSPHAPNAPLPPLPPIPPLAPTGQLDGASTTAQINVKGAITLRLEVTASDLEITRGAPGQVKASLVDADIPGTKVRINDRGDRVDVVLERADCGQPGKRCGRAWGGRLQVQIPAASRIEASVLAGNVTIADVGGEVHLRVTTGDVKVKSATTVEATLVSGDVRLTEVRGPVRLRTVSGDAHIEQNAGAPGQLEFGTTDGDLDWSGSCGAGCRIEARSTSGDVRLHLPKTSSFELSYVSHSGELNDGLKLNVLNQVENPFGGASVHARLGKGEGLVEVQTFNGELSLAPGK